MIGSRALGRSGMREIALALLLSAAPGCHAGELNAGDNWPDDDAVSMFLRLSIPPQTDEQKALLAQLDAPGFFEALVKRIAGLTMLFEQADTTLKPAKFFLITGSLAAVTAGVSPADANRLAKVLNAAGLSSKKVADWGAGSFTKLASSPRTIAELEATLPLVKSGRIVGLEDWLKFCASKTGDDAVRVSAELSRGQAAGQGVSRAQDQRRRGWQGSRTR
ncbi:MAG: hypothetical protein HC794_07255 [Nitrospiraceae bacterium]|nr:hypothetical protein [Nitrospiraceae bacterium]